MTRRRSSADGSPEQPAGLGKLRSLAEITSTPLRVALAYAFAGVVWIVTTDRIVQWLFGSGSHLLHAQTTKGIAYVVTTTALVYWLTRQAMREAQSTRLAGERLLLTQALLENFLASLGDAVLVVDPSTRAIVQCNPATEVVFGYKAEELIGQNAAMLSMSPEAYQTFSALSESVLESHGVFHTECRMRRKDGTVIETEHTITPIHEGLVWKTGMVSIVREISERKQAEALLTTRLKLQEIAATLPLSGLLRKTLDEIERLTGSEVGFCHFVEPDQRTLSLQAWSTRTTEEFCTAQGVGLHYNVDDAGVWVDCVHERRPIIHNDYATLPHRKGLPEGHSPVIRELVVPVIRKEKMVAILGIGNKPTDYTREDVEQVSSLADISWEIIERKRAEAERERLMAAIEQAGETVLITDPQGTIQYVNPAFEAVTGYAPQEAIGKTPRLLRSGRQSPRFYEELWSTIASGRVWKGRMVNKRKDGTLFAEEATISPVRDASGQIVNYVAVKRDLTEELQLEAQLAQAQKMESVGRLAGGVAHDFNNMLGVILGNTEMALLQATPETPLHESLTEVRKAARRSADLTRQLLAFARKQTIDPKPLNLNTTVEGMLKMLRRLIGEQIQLSWHPGESLWLVNMDPAQIDQILANLCVNARDALAEKGSVTIEVRNVTLDETYCASQYGGIPGDYVMLTVSDNGCGMDDETREHIFEPFFTTKEIGKGTGLGLSTVYGIVKQNNGFIYVASEPGRGSAFKIHIPRLKSDATQTAQTGPEAIPRGHGETVLLVEDEVAMPNMTKRALERLGYNVLASASPSEAIRLAQIHAGKLDMLMSDVVMPEMNGKELSERLSENRPELKCLYMSGYTSDVIGHHGVLDQGVHFIQKPFSIQDLATKLREVLDAG